MAMITLADVRAAAARIEGRVLRTPAIRCDAISRATGAEVTLKLENLQATGAFKERGAANRLALLSEAERKAGAKSFGLVGAHTVEDRLLPVPSPWVSRELEVKTEGGLVGEQRLRIAVVAREKDGRLWLGSIYYPASLADAVAPAVADLLSSAR